MLPTGQNSYSPQDQLCKCVLHYPHFCQTNIFLHILQESFMAQKDIQRECDQLTRIRTNFAEILISAKHFFTETCKKLLWFKKIIKHVMCPCSICHFQKDKYLSIVLVLDSFLNKKSKKCELTLTRSVSLTISEINIQ